MSLDATGSSPASPRMDGVFAFILAANDPIGETDFRAFGIVIERGIRRPRHPKTSGCGCTAAEDRAPLGPALDA